MVHCLAIPVRVPVAAEGSEFTRLENSVAVGECDIYIARRVGSRLKITSG